MQYSKYASKIYVWKIACLNKINNCVDICGYQIDIILNIQINWAFKGKNNH